MEILINIGFEEVGQWVLDPKNRNKIIFQIKEEYLNKSELLYSFISEGYPYYFGITDKELKERMNNYKAGKEDGTAGSTNKKVYKMIFQFLNSGKSVKIFILNPKYTLEYEGYSINIGKGIEHSMIQRFDSDKIWNNRHSQKTKTTPPRKQTLSTRKYINENSFYIKRGIEFNKGWILFGKDFYSKIPDKSCTINLIIGENKNSKEYHFTCSGNNRKINAGVDLIKWISSLNTDDKVAVEILSKTEFKILKK